MFYGEDIDNMVGGINFINDAIVPDPEREFSLVVCDKRLALIRTALKRFNLLDYSMKKLSVRTV